MATRPEIYSTLMTFGATIVAAALGTWGTLEVQSRQGQSAVAVESRRLEASLILQALSAPSKAERIENLRFFQQAGLLSLDQEKLDALTADSKAVPFVPSASRRPPLRLKYNEKASEAESCRRPITDQEMRQFQKQHGIKPTGEFDGETQKAIEEMEARCGTPYSPSLDFSDPRNSGYLSFF
jgi:hypothetical protein